MDTRTRLAGAETSWDFAIDETAESNAEDALGQRSGAGRRGRKCGTYRPSGRRGQATGPGDRPHTVPKLTPLPVRAKPV